MKRSTTRFLTTHMGSLARPDDLSAMLTAKDAGEPYDADALSRRVAEAVAEVVREQAANGIDIVNDGEFSKFSWAAYFADRLGGIERRQQQAADVPPPISARDMQVFPEWFAIVGPGGSRDLIRRVQQPNVQGTQIVGGTTARRAYCTGPLTYIGQKDTATDIANLKAAALSVQVEELYLSALSPVTAEYFVTNQYYKTQEELVFAYAEAMNQEYRAIADAGILLQIDEPGIITMWQVHGDKDVAQYRRWMEPRIEAINVSLKGIPEDRVRMHCCWGSSHHPHSQDIPLRDTLDMLLKVNVGAYSLEAANPRHDGDWRVWRTSSCRMARSSSRESSGTTPTSSRAPSWWPTATSSTPMSRAKRTSMAARTAASARASGTLHWAGRSFVRCGTARRWRLRWLGASPPHPTFSIFDGEGAQP